jgi:hypothetical protein
MFQPQDDRDSSESEDAGCSSRGRLRSSPVPVEGSAAPWPASSRARGGSRDRRADDGRGRKDSRADTGRR